MLLLRGRVLDAGDRALLTAFAGHARVLRERREAQRERIEAADLAEGNRTRTALLAAVSHDLRSPLAAIKAAASSLRSTDIDWSPQDEAELLATIEESADRLDNLVGNLLDMSRLQTGRITPLLAEVDLPQLVARAVRPLAGQERVQFDRSRQAARRAGRSGPVGAGAGQRGGERDQAHPVPSPIEIRGCTFTEQDRSVVSVRVVDHGAGIPEESREDSFAPFQRLGDVPNGEGLGLGLAVARGLAEAMDGSVTAEETPGGGLTMAIDLPAVVVEPSRTHGWDARAELEKVAAVTSVLAVDDDPAILRTLKINLRARSYEVQTAADGRSALQIVAEEEPDVIILDLGLPDMDGVAVLRQLRSAHQTPVVVLSARQESDDIVEALDEGADDYVTKPFGMEELLARVRTALRRGQVGRQPMVVTAGVLELDLGEQRAKRAGRAVHLTPDGVAVGGRAGPPARPACPPAGVAATGVGTQLRAGDQLPARLSRPAPPQARGRALPAAALHHRTRRRLPLHALTRHIFGCFDGVSVQM